MKECTVSKEAAIQGRGVVVDNICLGKTHTLAFLIVPFAEETLFPRGLGRSLRGSACLSGGSSNTLI